MDQTIYEGESNQVQLIATGSSGNYGWTPMNEVSCPDCPSTIAYPNETTVYTVNLTDSNNCTATDNVTITIGTRTTVYIPNAFSPDGDEFNNVLYVQGEGIGTMVLTIYNRWGEIVFESNDMNYGWDGTYGQLGKLAQQGIYTWVLIYTEDNDQYSIAHQLVGHVTLIR